MTGGQGTVRERLRIINTVRIEAKQISQGY